MTNSKLRDHLFGFAREQARTSGSTTTIETAESVDELLETVKRQNGKGESIARDNKHETDNGTDATVPAYRRAIRRRHRCLDHHARGAAKATATGSR